MTEDNWSRQADEVEALSSIYGDEWQVIDPVERRYSIKINGGSENSVHSVLLQVAFSDEYPSNAPPVYELHAPRLRGKDRSELEKRMQDICHENIGECLVYQFIDTIRQFVEDKVASSVEDKVASGTDRLSVESSEVCTRPLGRVGSEDEECSDVEPDEYGFDPACHIYQPDGQQVADTNEDVPLPEIHHGEKVSDRKSVFQGHLAAIYHKQQVKMVLDSLKENRKIAAATHNIIAYRIDGGNGVFFSGCEDDGEIHAGSRMLHLLNIMDARNVLVVVTRWYGGVHLGPDRFKHINNCTRDLLDQYGYIKEKGEKKGPKTTSSTSQQKKKR